MQTIQKIVLENRIHSNEQSAECGEDSWSDRAECILGMTEYVT